MKNNKKGFTLAELLIVIAIIAILIAIAIPAFSAQLENARLQADHANMRSAYGIVQTANLTGDDMDGDSTTTDIELDAIYCTDGAFHKTGGTPVTLTAAKSSAGTAADAKSSCKSAAKCIGHDPTKHIKVTGSTGKWDIALG